MKKKLVVVLLFVALFLSPTFVSAQDFGDSVTNVGSALFEIVRPLLELITGETANPETFLARVLFLAILFALLYEMLGRVPFFAEGNTWVLITIAIAGSILSVRWIGGSEIVHSMILPYSALGISFTAGLPFILYFILIKGLRPTSRKLAWLFFTAVFIGLWFTRRSEIGAPGNVYLIAAAAAIVMIWMDGTIAKIHRRIRHEKGKQTRKNRRHAMWTKRLDDVEKAYRLDPTGYAAQWGSARTPGLKSYESDVKFIEKRILDNK